MLHKELDQLNAEMFEVIDVAEPAQEMTSTTATACGPDGGGV